MTHTKMEIPFQVITRDHPERPGITITTLHTESPDGVENIGFHRFSDAPNELHISVGHPGQEDHHQCWLCAEQMAVILQHLNAWATEVAPGVPSVKH